MRRRHPSGGRRRRFGRLPPVTIQTAVVPINVSIEVAGNVLGARNLSCTRVSIDVPGAGISIDVPGAGIAIDVRIAGITIDVPSAGITIDVSGAGIAIDVFGAGIAIDVFGVDVIVVDPINISRPLNVFVIQITADTAVMTNIVVVDAAINYCPVQIDTRVPGVNVYAVVHMNVNA